MCDLNNDRCPSGRTPRFLQPCILLLLYQKKSYGYELIDKLKKCGFIETTPDPGIVYRILRKFEKEGFVEST
jgi:DNA-binding PadR family transcriptional regulator